MVARPARRVWASTSTTAPPYRRNRVTSSTVATPATANPAMLPAGTAVITHRVRTRAAAINHQRTGTLKRSRYRPGPVTASATEPAWHVGCQTASVGSRLVIDGRAGPRL